MNYFQIWKMKEMNLKLFRPSKYGSQKKRTDNGNIEFVEKYLTEYLDNQIIKWKNIPVLRKQMKWLKEYGMSEINNGQAYELGLFLENYFEIEKDVI